MKSLRVWPLDVLYSPDSFATLGLFLRTVVHLVFPARLARKQVVWTIKKFQGATELTLRAKVTLPNVVNAANRKEVNILRGSIPMKGVLAVWCE